MSFGSNSVSLVFFAILFLFPILKEANYSQIETDLNVHLKYF